MSKIRPVGQNWPSKDSNLAHWTALKQVHRILLYSTVEITFVFQNCIALNMALLKLHFFSYFKEISGIKYLNVHLSSELAVCGPRCKIS